MCSGTLCCSFHKHCYGSVPEKRLHCCIINIFSPQVFCHSFSSALKPYIIATLSQCHTVIKCRMPQAPNSCSHSNSIHYLQTAGLLLADLRLSFSFSHLKTLQIMPEGSHSFSHSLTHVLSRVWQLLSALTSKVVFSPYSGNSHNSIWKSCPLTFISIFSIFVTLKYI